MSKKNIYERFIWFDRQMRAGKFPNATALACRFETSVKTAQRDVEFMRDRLGCPLSYEKSRKGYYYEDDTFRLPSIFLSSGEISSLLIAKKVLQDISIGYLGGELSSVISKLAGFLESHGASPGNLDKSISLKHTEYLPSDDGIFRTVLDGCLSKRRLRISYRRSGTRAVDPYHVFNYKGTWHLLAYCHERGCLRDFVLGRISSVEILDTDFISLPDGFAPDDYFAGSFGLFRGGARKKVVLRFLPRAAEWVGGQVWHEEQETKTFADGSVELSFTVSSFTEVKNEVLKYGALVEVVTPKALRDMVISEAQGVLDLYGR